MNSSNRARYWRIGDDGVIVCELCPRECRFSRDQQRGVCYVRQRQGDELIQTTWGRSSGFCIDPIEKKPLNHFFPGSSVLSFGTAGCNLACLFCQNAELSKAELFDCRMEEAPPDTIAHAAARYRCASVAFTYNDPVVFAEYAMDTADECRKRGIKTVAVTAGYMNPGPRRDFFRRMDAANVDLKAFTDRFYRELAGVRLQPVLDTLRYIRRETETWLEITTLLIPGQNDSDEELQALCRWVVADLGPDVPLHFSAFHPSYRLLDIPPTPSATLTRAREAGLQAGLYYVYTGNVHDRKGGTTFCPACGETLIVRDWYQIQQYRLTEAGNCPFCGVEIAGRFGAAAGEFGNRREMVHIGESAAGT